MIALLASRPSDVRWSIAAILALAACTHSQPGLTTATPQPQISVKSTDAIGSAWGATVAHPIQIHISHGDLKAVATYPLDDYNNSGLMATRFQVNQGRDTVLDKLVDAMPVDLRIVTLENSHTVVLLDVFSGGAHCCFSTALADPNSGSGPFFTKVGWGDLSYKLVKSASGSGYVFLSADDALAYAFSSFAGSTFPIQIVSYRQSKFVDVTNEYQAAVNKDAATHWHEYLTDASQNAPAPQSSLVAYLADEYRLGHPQLAWQRVHAAYGVNKDFDTRALSWLQSNGYAPARGPRSESP